MGNCEQMHNIKNFSFLALISSMTQPTHLEFLPEFLLAALPPLKLGETSERQFLERMLVPPTRALHALIEYHVDYLRHTENIRFRKLYFIYCARTHTSTARC